ncbi:MAG: type II toxin-antitoxin system RelE/ParE family toxin [Gammaproteobacteria bacterium]|nr:type II toxin-antitoxin system RelE/ParE family toxin [Gammaproteobacteria bacterium]
MSRFLFRPQALDDLRELLTWIAGDSPKTSESMHDQNIGTCEVLADNPLIAAELEGLSVTGIRRIPVVKYPRYSIFYQVIGDRIEIVRPGFGGRDWESSL